MPHPQTSRVYLVCLPAQTDPHTAGAIEDWCHEARGQEMSLKRQKRMPKRGSRLWHCKEDSDGRTQTGWGTADDRLPLDPVRPQSYT